MKKFLRIAAVMAAFATVGAVSAVARTSHNQATQSAVWSARTVSHTGSKSASLDDKGLDQNRAARRQPEGSYLAYACQQQKSVCDVLVY